MENNKKLINLIYIFNISLCFFLLIYGLICGITGSDFFWHVKTGEWILTNKQIPTNDVFAWYASSNNYIWYAHEWLSDVIYFIIYKFTGMKGISIFALFSLSMSHLLLIKCTQHKWIKYPKFAIFWFLYNILTLSFVMQCRPFTFSFIFLTLELYIIYNFLEKDNFKEIYFIPIISILWSNMHGGSSNLSYIILIMFLMLSLIKDFEFYRLETKKEEKNKIKKLFIITISTIIANCINPYGIEMLFYPYKYMLKGSFDMKVISEWQALDLKTGLGLILVVGLVVSSIFILISKKNIKLTNLLLFGAFAYLMLKSIRFEFLFFIVASYIVFDYIPDEIENFMIDDFFNIGIKLFTLICIVFSFVMLFISNNFIYVKPTIPQELIKIIKESDNERLYNFYNYGGELIFHDISPFVDSRADVYSGNGELLEESWAIAEMDSIYLKDDSGKYLDIDYYVNDKYNFDSVLLPYYAPLNIYLEKENFKQVYNKNGIIYWERIINE